MALSAAAQTPPMHYPFPVGMPPGVVGQQQLGRGGPIPGYYQPVEITAPRDAQIALAENGGFSRSQGSVVKAGFLVGQVYRVSVHNLAFNAGMEVYPTIEVIDRLYTPVGQEWRFPIKIELTQDDLQLALDGKFVTRVIYLEDPERAIPAASRPRDQAWFEVAPGRDPLAVADVLGRPVAIVRMGGRVPDMSQGPDARFLFGSPPYLTLPAVAAAPANPQGTRQ